jgi:hypothetical protein
VASEKKKRGLFFKTSVDRCFIRRLLLVRGEGILVFLQEVDEYLPQPAWGELMPPQPACEELMFPRPAWEDLLFPQPA